MSLDDLLLDYTLQQLQNLSSIHCRDAEKSHCVFADSARRLKKHAGFFG